MENAAFEAGKCDFCVEIGLLKRKNGFSMWKLHFLKRENGISGWKMRFLKPENGISMWKLHFLKPERGFSMRKLRFACFTKRKRVHQKMHPLFRGFNCKLDSLPKSVAFGVVFESHHF